MGAERSHPPACRYDGLAAFRYSSYDTPFWARANSASGRWHEAGEDATQYLALHPGGAWAELARAEDLHTDADLALVGMPIWVARISEQLVADHGDFAAAERAGVPPDALVDDDHARCRAEGRRLRGLGFRGVIAPSAALPGHLNLTLFGPRVMSDWTPAPELASTTPAARVAVGAPPAGLAARVRFVGQPHAGLRAHRREARRPAGAARARARGPSKSAPIVRMASEKRAIHRARPSTMPGAWRLPGAAKGDALQPPGARSAF